MSSHRGEQPPLFAYAKEGSLLSLRIHAVCRHIVVNRLSVPLFFLLNTVKHISQAFLRKFKNAGIIKVGSVLFHCKNVGAKVAVVLFRVGIRYGISSGETGLSFIAACGCGGCSVFYLFKHAKMVPFGFGNG